MCTWKDQPKIFGNDVPEFIQNSDKACHSVHHLIKRDDSLYIHTKYLIFDRKHKINPSHDHNINYSSLSSVCVCPDMLLMQHAY